MNRYELKITDNISKKALRPDKYNSIVRWVQNDD